MWGVKIVKGWDGVHYLSSLDGEDRSFISISASQRPRSEHFYKALVVKAAIMLQTDGQLDNTNVLRLELGNCIRRYLVQSWPYTYAPIQNKQS